MNSAIFRVFSRALILALLLAAVLPVAALADEGTPPTEPAPVEEGTGAVEQGSVGEGETAPPELEASIEVLEEIATEPISEPMDAEEATEEVVDSLLAELPADTEVVVVSAEGEILPLASEDAAEILAVGDPMWCPVGVNPGGVGCSSSYGSLSELVASGFIPTGNGVIWIEGGVDPGNNVSIDGGPGGNWDAASGYSLTLKGGWNGCNPTCVSTIDQNNPSVFDTIIEVYNWDNDVTLSDIVISGAATNVNALYIRTTGKITLTRVDSSSNAGPGAYLENSAAEGKDVTVTNGTFQYNGDGDSNEYGLEIHSKGVITLSGIKAIGNEANGVYLGNNTAGTPKNVIITNAHFEFNGGNGLSVDASGLITLKDIDAIHNGLSGVVMSNMISATNQGITLTGLNIFGENGLDGLAIDTKGAITISNLVANENNRYGAYLVNTGGTASVTLTGSNEFKFNNDRGLYIRTNGTITLSNITATNNQHRGIDLANHTSLTGAGITFIGAGIFDDNGGQGLWALSTGSITLNGIHASGNGWNYVNSYGVSLDNSIASSPKAVTLNGINSFEGNYATGLEINSKGQITVNNIYSSNNTGKGAILSNDYAGAVGGVTVTGTATFTTTGGGFFDNANIGLEVWSRGAVTVKDFDAIGNGFHGVYIDNQTPSGPSVYVGTSIMPWRVGLLENAQSGIEIYSQGAITLNRVAAYGNLGDGAILYNFNAATPKTVTISTSGSDDLSRADFNNNGGNGLTIVSKGAITISHLNASENGWGLSGGYGAKIDNCYWDSGSCLVTTPAAVTLNGNNTFSWNQTGAINSGYGLQISSKGAITINNIIADNNENVGVELNNNFPGATAGVTVNNTSSYMPSFSGNMGTGLYVGSRGSITIKDFDATGNDEYGVLVDNSMGTSNVSVGTSRPKWSNGVWNNGYSGIEVFTNGTVTVWNVWGDSNGEYGIYIDNTGASTPKSVTFNSTIGTNGPNWNKMDGNGKTGYYIVSKGPITLNYCSAWGNGTDAPSLAQDPLGAGIFLDNLSNPLAPQNVTLNGINVGDNYYTGIEVRTYGSITGKDFYAEHNGWGQPLDEDKYGFGALLVNDSGTTPKPVTISGTNDFEENWSAGLWISSLSAITVNNLEAWYNQGEGAVLLNILGTAKPVTITGYADVGENGSTGLMVVSTGLITTATIYADGNGWDTGADGVDLNNDLTGTTAGVTLNGNNGFYGNNGYGLYVSSFGPIKANNLRGEFNDFSAVYLDNDWDESTTAATITITGTQDLDFNGGNGLLIYSKKAITISNLYAEGNGFNGAYIENIDSGVASTQTVTLTGTNRVEGNSLTGLVVYSYGAITISNLNASGNGWTSGGDGAWIDNCIYDSFLDECLAQAAKPIILSGNNTIDTNQAFGLVVESIGAITINNLFATNNGFDGAYLKNQWGQNIAGGFIKLTGTNTFTENGFSGLVAYSHGTITLNNMTASLNGVNGAYFDNYGIDPSPQVDVVLTGVNTFNSNGDWLSGSGSGLVVYSEGDISISTLTANWNAEDGAYLNNHDYVFGIPTVTLTGINTFLANGNNGLTIYAWGSVILNKVRADDNGYFGVDVYSEVGGITIVCGSMTDNGVYGWYLGADTPITLKAVVALGNGINGWSNLTPIVVRSC